MDRGVFHRTVTRRRLVGILLGTAAASLAACAPSAPAQPTQPAAKPTTGEQKPAAQPTTAPKPTAAPAQAGTVDLRLWILKTYVEPTNKAIEASAAEWAQKNNAKVTVEYFTFEDMSTKYVAAIETGSTPDVGQLETFAPVRFAGMGQLLDLTDFSKSIEGEVGTPFENVRPVMFGPDGKVVSIPWYTMHGFLYVWRDMLEQAGLTNPTTFEEWKQVGKALTKADQNLYGIGHSWNRTTDGYGVMQSLMFSYGASWCDEKGAYKSIQTPEMKAAMTWATDIYKEKIVPPDALSWSGSANNEAFIARKVATTHNGPSITFALEDQVAKAKDAKEKAEKERLLENAVALHSPA
ncbi:MAG TPA: extracellular solute-binding protein, partial [Chloroflexota bacterium]